MTVLELIKKLEALPDLNQRILVQGYEGGYTELKALREELVAKRSYEVFYMGEFEDWCDDPIYHDGDDGGHFKAWIIPR